MWNYFTCSNIYKAIKLKFPVYSKGFFLFGQNCAFIRFVSLWSNIWKYHWNNTTLCRNLGKQNTATLQQQSSLRLLCSNPSEIQPLRKSPPYTQGFIDFHEWSIDPQSLKTVYWRRLTLQSKDSYFSDPWIKKDSKEAWTPLSLSRTFFQRSNS